MKRLPLFTTWQWVTIVGGLVVAGISVTTFAFSNFVSRSDFDYLRDHLDKRFDRIECRLDAKAQCQ